MCPLRIQKAVSLMKVLKAIFLTQVFRQIAALMAVKIKLGDKTTLTHILPYSLKNNSKNVALNYNTKYKYWINTLRCAQMKRFVLCCLFSRQYLFSLRCKFPKMTCKRWFNKWDSAFTLRVWPCSTRETLLITFI